MERDIGHYLESLKNFDGSILVMKDDEILIQTGYGYADREIGIRNQSETRHLVGSISKSFTALSIMQLQEQQALTLDDPLSKYVTGFSQGDQITIKHLLIHKSGITDHLTLKNELLWEKDYSVNHIIETIRAKRLRFSPGAKWGYSNANYLLLGYIIELVSGQNYYDYVKSNIFKPAKMNRSGFYSDHLKDLSKGYINGRPSPKILGIGLTFACGDLVSTVDDLYQYHLALGTGELLTHSGVQEMYRSHHHGKYVQYGYGWYIHNRWGNKIVSHPGMLPSGYTGLFERFLDSHVVICVLCNQQFSDSILYPKKLRGTWIGRHIGEIIFNKTLPFYKKWI